MQEDDADRLPEEPPLDASDVYHIKVLSLDTTCLPCDTASAALQLSSMWHVCKPLRRWYCCSQLLAHALLPALLRHGLAWQHLVAGSLCNGQHFHPGRSTSLSTAGCLP